MKQYIILAQLNELSNEGREKLREYLFRNAIVQPLDNNTLQSTPLITLSIGQMIEFLTNKREEGLTIYDETPYIFLENRKHHEEPGHMWTTNEWTVRCKHPNPWKEIDLTKESLELCDALWEAVKSILNQATQHHQSDTQG